MTKLSPIFLILLIHTKIATPQFLRPPPFNLLNRPETIIEPTNYIPAPTVISEPPCNSVVPIPNMAKPPTTTIITDCSPTICKNLADTIQLMIACNLLQNTQGGPEMALQLAAPIINEVISSPMLTCGCGNSISSDILSPNIISPKIVTPNLIPPNVIPPNFVSSIPPNKPLIFEPVSPSVSPVPQNMMPSCMFKPNLVTQMPPNVASNLIPPNVMSQYSISPNMSPDMVPLTPRMMNPPDSCSNNLSPNIVSGIPNRVSPNLPMGAANTKELINTIMSILGNVQG